MKRPRLLPVALAGSLLLSTAASANELLVNGGAETGDLTGWSDPLGFGFTVKATPPAGYEGSFAFHAGAFGAAGSYNHELQQDADVSAYQAAIDAGAATSRFDGQALSAEDSGWVDEARVTLEFLASDTTTVLGTYDSGTVAPYNTWISVGDVRTPPVGTRTIRVRLRGTRNIGISTDAWFDALSLTVECEAAASVAFRTAGTNPASYTATPPVLGGTFTAVVDNALAGQTTSVLFAFDTPVSVTLAGGQAVLCLDSGPGELFTGAGLFPSGGGGGTDTFSLIVPDLPGLCGSTVYTQAIQFGNPPFVLSNAQDLVVGAF